MNDVNDANDAVVVDSIDAGGTATPAGTARPVLAVLEAMERHGHVTARLPIHQWPVTVGRALDADMVLDDPHVAAHHLRLEPAGVDRVRAHVLETRNGVQQGRQQHPRHSQFDWAHNQSVGLGRLQLRLRMATAPLAEELPLPRASFGAGVLSVVSVALLLVLMVAQLWLRGAGLDGSWQALPQFLLSGLGILFLWAGLWALASRVITHQAQFWRHVRIACAAVVLGTVVEMVMQVLAFAFSWEMLGRFAYLALVGFAAWGLYRHLVVAAPQSRRGILVGVLLVLLVGVPATLGSQWLKNRRLSDQLYLSQFYPPSWRLAKPVPTAQFLTEAQDLERRLAARLEKDPDEAGDAAEDDEEE